ncbi:hypothetical protein ACSBR2_013250 [Camellia fascicularis]
MQRYINKSGKCTSITANLYNPNYNWGGKLIDGVVSSTFSTSAQQSEAQAIRLACAFSQALGLSNVLVENDNKAVIELCVSELVPPWNCLAIMHDIKAMSSSSVISFSWVPREVNCAAHWLASVFLKGSLPLDWVKNLYSEQIFIIVRTLRVQVSLLSE